MQTNSNSDQLRRQTLKTHVPVLCPLGQPLGFNPIVPKWNVIISIVTGCTISRMLNDKYKRLEAEVSLGDAKQANY